MKSKIYNLLLVLTMAVIICSCDDDPLKVSFENASVKVLVGEDSTLTARVTGDGAKAITWSTSNASVVSVDANGKLEAVSPGTANVTATSNGVKATCAVTVVNGYRLDGELTEIVTGVHGTHSGGHRFYLYPTEETGSMLDDASEYVSIDIPTEMMGESFALTEENLYDWGWWIEYSIVEVLYYSGFGDEGNMEDVASGTMFGNADGENSYTVTANILLTDGKTFKVGYSGSMVQEIMVARIAGRKSTLGKGNDK